MNPFNVYIRLSFKILSALCHQSHCVTSHSLMILNCVSVMLYLSGSLVKGAGINMGNLYRNAVYVEFLGRKWISLSLHMYIATQSTSLCIMHDQFMIWYDIFVSCNWVDTQWQQYSKHLHKNNTQNNTINNFGWKAFLDSNPEWSN